MTNTHPPAQTNADVPLVTDFAKNATIAAAIIWLLALLTLLTINLPGLTVLVPFLLLHVTTVFLLFFGVPVLFLSWVRPR